MLVWLVGLALVLYGIYLIVTGALVLGLLLCLAGIVIGGFGIHRGPRV